MPDCSTNLSQTIKNHVPSLEELSQVFRSALGANFRDVEVNIETCPDLKAAPFSMQSSGFGRNLKIAEVGGPGNIFPGFNIDHQFDFGEVARTCQNPTASIFGPGAGPWPIVGVNSEMVADVNLKSGTVGTRIGKIENDTYRQIVIDQPKFSLMGNLALSDADESSDVVHFKVSTRLGSGNLTDTIREGLQQNFGEKVVSLAGIFIIHSGKAKLHVMPDFPGCPFENSQEVDKWLRYFEMSAPLTCACVMHSTDPGANLRLEHTHCYSAHGDVGHYHYDTTPESVVYEGWFAPSNEIHRIDEIEPR